MGGDLAPAAAVEGALRARRERGLQVLLVGDEPRVRAELSRLGAKIRELQVQHASEVVEMGEHPGQALRRKKDSSIRVRFDLCEERQVERHGSAGNSGAVLAEGSSSSGGSSMSIVRASAAFCLLSAAWGGGARDMGANIVCTPLQLVQFALMGEVFAREVWASPPRASASSPTAKKKRRERTSPAPPPKRCASARAAFTSRATSRARTSSPASTTSSPPTASPATCCSRRRRERSGPLVSSQAGDLRSVRAKAGALLISRPWST